MKNAVLGVLVGVGLLAALDIMLTWVVLVVVLSAHWLSRYVYNSIMSLPTPI